MGELLQFHSRLNQRPQRFGWGRVVVVLVLAVVAGFVFAGCYEPDPDPFDALAAQTDRCIASLKTSIENTTRCSAALVQCMQERQTQP